MSGLEVPSISGRHLFSGSHFGLTVSLTVLERAASFRIDLETRKGKHASMTDSSGSASVAPTLALVAAPSGAALDRVARCSPLSTKDRELNKATRENLNMTGRDYASSSLLDSERARPSSLNRLRGLSWLFPAKGLFPNTLRKKVWRRSTKTLRS